MGNVFSLKSCENHWFWCFDRHLSLMLQVAALSALLLSHLHHGVGSRVFVLFSCRESEIHHLQLVLQWQIFFFASDFVRFSSKLFLFFIFELKIHEVGADLCGRRAPGGEPHGDVPRTFFVFLAIHFMILKLNLSFWLGFLRFFDFFS